MRTLSVILLAALMACGGSGDGNSITGPSQQNQQTQQQTQQPPHVLSVSDIAGGYVLTSYFGKPLPAVILPGTAAVADTLAFGPTGLYTETLYYCQAAYCSGTNPSTVGTSGTGNWTLSDSTVSVSVFGATNNGTFKVSRNSAGLLTLTSTIAGPDSTAVWVKMN